MERRRYVQLGLVLLSLAVGTGCRRVEQAPAPDRPARKVQLFDPEVLGTRTTQPVTLLLAKASADEVEPIVVWSDVSCGRYTGATVRYLEPVTVADLRASVDRLYAPDRAPGVSNMWRVAERFSILLVDDGESGVKAIYLLLTPRSEVKKAVREVEGSATMSGPDCKAWEEAFVYHDAARSRERSGDPRVESDTRH